MLSIHKFSESQKILLEVVDNYPKKLVDKKFYGEWTIREVVGHISAWNKYFTKVLTNLINNKNTKHWGNINEFNRKEVEKRKGQSLVELIKELKQAGNNFIRTYKTLDNNTLNKRVWIEKKYTPKDILKIQINHYESQTRHIRKRY